MSNEVFLLNDVVIFFLIESLLLFIYLLCTYFTIGILKKWNIKSVTVSQYNLETKSYLVTTFIYFTFFIKLFMLPYFAYTLDKLSLIVPGAMCGAGVISSNIYGEKLLILKIIVLFFISAWLIINKLDIEKKMFPYFRKKFIFFILIVIILIGEFILDILYFNNISTQNVAICCSIIYSKNTSNILPFGLTLQSLLILFYLTYIFIVVSNSKYKVYFSGLLNILFLYLSYYALLYFFGTYIYELPTHHCPFCMLQKEYYFIGYPIFILLFLGTFFGSINLVLYSLTKNNIKKYYRYSTIYNTLFVSICTIYVLLYYIKNGVLL